MLSRKAFTACLSSTQHLQALAVVSMPTPRHTSSLAPRVRWTLMKSTTQRTACLLASPHRNRQMVLAISSCVPAYTLFRFITQFFMFSISLLIFRRTAIFSQESQNGAEQAFLAFKPSGCLPQLAAQTTWRRLWASCHRNDLPDGVMLLAVSDT